MLWTTSRLSYFIWKLQRCTNKMLFPTITQFLIIFVLWITSRSSSFVWKLQRRTWNKMLFPTITEFLVISDQWNISVKNWQFFSVMIVVIFHNILLLVFPFKNVISYFLLLRTSEWRLLWSDLLVIFSASRIVFYYIIWLFCQLFGVF